MDSHTLMGMQGDSERIESDAVIDRRRKQAARYRYPGFWGALCESFLHLGQRFVPGLLLPVVLLLEISSLTGLAQSKSVDIRSNADDPTVAYAIQALKNGLTQNGYAVQEDGKTTCALAIEPEGLAAEAFEIDRQADAITVRGGDATGVMYGVFSLVEQLDGPGSLKRIKPKSQSPELSFRAIKFNLPWNPYRNSPALFLHQETTRNLDFWRSFLDMMARNRFNTLTLWSLHPFHLMVRTDEFPEACPLSEEELSEWRQFWHRLFALAQERGIEPYLVNWNIFVSPAFAKAHDVAEYSIPGDHYGKGDTSAIIKRYNREVITEVINTYPNLTGLGLSVGERMGGMTHAEREKWLQETIIAGMEAADRPVKLIHRAPFSAGNKAETITRQAIEDKIDLEEPIQLPIKFNWSHGHSTPKLVHAHGGPLTDAYWSPQPKNYDIVWTVRNEDFFALRWGRPDFIRNHIDANHHDYVGGYIVGSETYIPAKDYFSKEDQRVSWDYAFQRQWLFYKLWGRLLYNPDTPDRVFKQAFTKRYGKESRGLFDAYRLVSRVPLRFASFNSSSWDFTLYSEGFLRTAGPPNGPHKGDPFISLEELIDQEPLEPAYLSIPEFVRRRQSNDKIGKEKTTPLELANRLDRDSKQALKRLAEMEIDRKTAAVFEELSIKAWAHLGRYFASKLRAGVALQTARATKSKKPLQKARRHLKNGIHHWEKLVTVTKTHYKKMPLTHLGNDRFHWSLLTDEVRQDLEQLTVKPDQ